MKIATCNPQHRAHFWIEGRTPIRHRPIRMVSVCDGLVYFFGFLISEASFLMAVVFSSPYIVETICWNSVVFLCFVSLSTILLNALRVRLSLFITHLIS